MDKQAVEILDKINFVERYHALCDQYAFSVKESFEDYDNRKVLSILQEIGYIAPKYQKRENFFQSLKNVKPYRFEHKIKTKSGIVELIWDVMKDNKYYMGNSFSNLVYFLYSPKKNVRFPFSATMMSCVGFLQ